MIFKIKNNYKDLLINLTQFTQLCGIDFLKKSFIIDSITKHFSNYKYQDFEENMINNVLFENDEPVGKKYFKIIRICNKTDIINLIKFTKASIFQEYINSKIEEFDFKKYLEQINDILEKLYININNEILNDLGNIKINFENENIFNIVQKSYIESSNGLNIEQNSNFELFNVLINIINRLQHYSPNKLLIIVDNIDHLINKEEYNKLYKNIINLINETDTFFLFSISINNYPIINNEYIDGINIINDVIFNFSNYEKFKSFILDNYPINVDLSDEKIFEFTNMIINYIGFNNININLKSNIFLKLLNDSLAVNSCIKSDINNIEISFINS